MDIGFGGVVLWDASPVESNADREPRLILGACCVLHAIARTCSADRSRHDTVETMPAAATRTGVTRLSIGPPAC